MEIQIKAYAYTIDIITEIRYFCKCNNAVFGKFRIIFTYAISKTDSFLHRSSHALFKISGNGKFVRTAVLPPHLPAISAKAHRTLAPRHPSQNRTIPRKSPSPLPYERSACFAKCSKSPTPLPPLEKGEVARLIQFFRLLYSIQIVLPL